MKFPSFREREKQESDGCSRTKSALSILVTANLFQSINRLVAAYYSVVLKYNYQRQC